jgi:hypothetical protein
LYLTTNKDKPFQLICFQAQSDKVPWSDLDAGNGEVDSDDEDQHVAEKAKHQVRCLLFQD